MKITKSKVKEFIEHLEDDLGYDIFVTTISKTCKKCGQFTENTSSNYCNYCGKKLPDAAEDPPRFVIINNIRAALIQVFKLK